MYILDKCSYKNQNNALTMNQLLFILVTIAHVEGILPYDNTTFLTAKSREPFPSSAKLVEMLLCIL